MIPEIFGANFSNISFFMYEDGKKRTDDLCFNHVEQRPQDLLINKRFGSEILEECD